MVQEPRHRSRPVGIIMTKHPYTPGEPGMEVSASVDAAETTAINAQTQTIIDGWHDANDIYRVIALHVSGLLKGNQDEAIAFRRTLTEWRLLVREMRLAFGGDK